MPTNNIGHWREEQRNYSFSIDFQMPKQKTQIRNKGSTNLEILQMKRRKGNCAAKEEKIGPTVPPKTTQQKRAIVPLGLHLPPPSDCGARLRDLRRTCCGASTAPPWASFRRGPSPALPGETTADFRFLQPPPLPQPHAAQVSPVFSLRRAERREREGKSSVNGTFLSMTQWEKSDRNGLESRQEGNTFQSFCGCLA